MDTKGYYLFPFNLVDKGKRIVIYGAGEIGNDFINQINKTGYCEILFLVDRNYKNIKRIKGYKVLSIDTLLQSEFDNIIIASVKYKKEISFELLQLNIDLNKIIYCDDSYVANSLEPIKIDLRELFMQQHINNKFNRMDIVVRLLAVENYYNLNEYGFKLYSKMQLIRGVDKTHELKRFKNLIKQIEQDGDINNPIVCNKSLQLIDGSHRIALAIYHNYKNILINMDADSNYCNYSIEWFIKNKFDNHEVEIILEKYEELCNKFNTPFLVTLWPTVAKHFDEMSRKLSSYCHVMEYKDYYFNKYEFERVVKGIYKIDDIEEWKIDKKISYMDGEFVKQIRVVKIAFSEPEFRIKQMNNKTISQQVEKIKARLRDDYRGKIENYFHDIIVHIGDNFLHSEHIMGVLDKDIKLNIFFESIVNDSYTLSKLDVPYLPVNFPYDYCLGKDIDIICTEDSFNNIVSKAITFAQAYKHKYFINIIHNKNNVKIRFEINHYMCFQIDISHKIDNLKDIFIKDAINKKEYNKGYYTLNKNFEYIIRLNEVLKNPSKIHHKEYLLKNKDDFEIELTKKYLEDINEIQDIVKCSILN